MNPNNSDDGWFFALFLKIFLEKCKIRQETDEYNMSSSILVLFILGHKTVFIVNRATYYKSERENASSVIFFFLGVFMERANCRHCHLLLINSDHFGSVCNMQY